MWGGGGGGFPQKRGGCRPGGNYVYVQLNFSEFYGILL